MFSRGRVGLSVVALLAAALGLSACFGAPPPPPPPPSPSPPPPPPPPAGPQCQALSTLLLESDSAAPVTYEAVVAAGDGTEYVSFEAASEAEVVEQVAEIEATVGPVTEVGEQTEVGILDVTPTDDPRYGGAPPVNGQQKTAYDHANFDNAWANGEDAAGVVVAVVDTGVHSHPDLASNLLPGADFVGPGGGACGDPNGHGTHVAGILGQVDNTIGGIGGAPGVDILPVRVLNASGNGDSTTVAAGIDWAVDQGADVINLSLGSNSPSSIDTAVNDAAAAGVTVIAAAGNCGDPGHLQKCGGVLNAPSYPAALPTAVAVGALTTAQNSRAAFSNNNSYVDIAAPGTNVDSTVPDPSQYETMSGTSMATPFVSAVAALILGDCAMLPSAVLSKIPSSAIATVSGFVNPTMKLLDADAASATCP